MLSLGPEILLQKNVGPPPSLSVCKKTVRFHCKNNSDSPLPQEYATFRVTKFAKLPQGSDTMHLAQWNEGIWGTYFPSDH